MTEAMRRLRELRERQSKERGRMAELSLVDELTNEQRSELDKIEQGTPDLERQLRAAQSAYDQEVDKQTQEHREDTEEGRELRALIGGASVADVFSAALEHRATDGQTAELQQHFRVKANQIPLALLEERAVTPAPADVGANQQPIVPGVFPQSCGGFLGVDMPTVPTGEAVFPVLATNADVKVPAEGADAAETTGSFTADALAPARLQASFFYSREDAARFAGMDEALRQNLSDALSDKLDQQILAGDNGLLHGANLANHNVNAATTFATYKADHGYGRVHEKRGLGSG